MKRISGRSSEERLRGFTLIELIITMAVLAVVVSIAAPSFQSLMANQRVKAAADELLMSIMYARTEAIKTRSAIAVVRTGDDWGNGWSVKQGDVVLRKDDKSGLLVSGFAGDKLTFSRNGRLSTEATFSVCDEAGKAEGRKINVSLSGQARVTKSGSCEQ